MLAFKNYSLKLSLWPLRQGSGGTAPALALALAFGLPWASSPLTVLEAFL